jgi:dihydroxyacetone kinase-like protein
MWSGCHLEPFRQLPRPPTAGYTRPIQSRLGRVVTVPTPLPSPPAAPVDRIDAADIRAGLQRALRIVERHAAELTRLDAVLGDGDHGDNLSTGFRAVDQLLAELPPETPPGDLLRVVGHRLVATVGGASGPLYGTAFIEAGFRAGDADVLDPQLVAEMLLAGAAGLARRGRCAVGDKTILDTLEPAADAFAAVIAAGGSAGAAQRAAIAAAREGMRRTRPLVARRGLALRLGDRSIGHLDPGAVSCFLLLIALARR